MELIEEDVDRHSLVSMAKHFVDAGNADGMNVNLFMWQVLFAEQLNHKQMEGIRDALLRLMDESFDESEVDHLNKCLKNKRKDYKFICLCIIVQIENQIWFLSVFSLHFFLWVATLTT